MVFLIAGMNSSSITDANGLNEVASTGRVLVYDILDLLQKC